MVNAHRLTSWFIPRSVLLAVVALTAAFFVIWGGPAYAQQPGNRPDFKVTAATFDGRNLHVEYINATGIGYPRIRYEVGFQWHDSQGQPVGIRHWLPVPEVERGGVSILDNTYRIELSYRRGGIYGRTLAQFIEERPQSATQLRVTVDDGNRVAEEDEKNNVAALTVPLPDLVIRHETLQDNLLTLTYRNDTTSYIRDWFRIAFQWVDKDGKPVGQEVYTNIARMDPTEERKFSSKGETVISGPTYRPVYQPFDAFLRDRAIGAEALRITIDSRNDILESSEGNNVVRVLPSRAPPDLVVERIAIVDGQPQATIWNQGKGPAQSVVVMHEYRDRAGKRLERGSGSRETAPLGLAPDQKIIAALLGPIPETAVTVAVTVDPKNAVAETNEQNNTKEAPAPMADFVIVEAKIADGTLSLTYRNAGNLKSGPLSIWFHFADAQGAQIDPLYWMDVSPIRAGGTQVLANETSYAYSSAGQVELAKLFTTPPVGATHLKVLLDGPNRIVETNEGNNAVLLTMPVIPLPDLTVTDLKIGKDAITWKEKNLGDTVSGNFSYLTTIAWLDTNGKSLSERSTQAATATIRAGSVSDEELSTRFNIPADFLALPAGAVKLRVTVDAKGTVVEKDEKNNTVEIVVPLPDLTVSDLKLTKDTITWQEKNLGDTAFGGFTYFTQIAWLDASGTVLGERNQQAATVELRAGSSSAEEMSIRFGAPASFLTSPSGATKLRVTIDPKGTVTEKDEGNNAVEIPVPLPDLTVTDLKIGKDAITWKEKNLGDTVSGNFSYLTQIAWLDASGAVLGERSIQAATVEIRAGAENTEEMSTKFGIPTAFLAPPVGTVKLRATVDAKGTVVEKDEGNNAVEVKVEAKPELPDLAFTNVFLVPPSRERLVIGFENRGKAAAPEFPWVMAWVDAAGKRVGTPYEGIGLALKATWRFGASSDMGDPKGKPMAIGKWLAHQKPDGATKLEIVIDPDNRIVESDEENNRQTFDEWVPPKPVEPEKPAQPDLILRDATLTDGKLRVTIVNIGKGSAERVMWQFAWLGTDGTELATSDVEAAVGTLKPGASYPVELPIVNARAFGIFRFLQDTPAGAIALRIAVDPKDAIAEVDERNNTARIEFAIPDLTLGTVESRDGSLRIEVKNLGTKESRATDIWLMWFGTKDSLSSSAAVDLPAIAVGSMTTVNVPLDGKTEASRILRDPPRDGTRLRIFLDGSRKVEEINEQNNDVMFDRAKLPQPSTPTVAKLPDLVVRDLVITPERPQRNTPVTFTVRVENAGEASVGKSSATWLNLIRPRDGAMTGPIPQRTTPDLVPGASASHQWEGEKYWTVQDGEHEVFICADSMGYVHESDEQNNCARKKFIVVPAVSVKPTQPDLVVQKVAFTPTNPEAGDVLTVTAVVRNAGNAAAPASVAWFTPNADSNDDDASAIPTPQNIPALAPGLSATVTWEEAWVAETGTEAFEVCADVEEAVAESNEGNNCRTAKLTVSDVSFLRRAVGFPLRVVLDVFSTPIRAGTAE